MKFYDYWKNLSKKDKTNIFLIGAGFVAFLFYWKFKLKYEFSKKVSKKVLVRAYKVNPKILGKWIKIFGSKEAKVLYADTPKKKVKLAYYSECLDKPSSRPKHNGKPIIYKEDIWTASGKSESTVYKKIKALENAKSIIGMSLDTYLSMRIFPPKHVNLILEFIKNGVKEQPDFLPNFDTDQVNLDRKLP